MKKISRLFPDQNTGSFKTLCRPNIFALLLMSCLLVSACSKTETVAPITGPRANFPFKEGVALTDEQATFLATFTQPEFAQVLMSQRMSADYFTHFQAGAKLSGDDANRLYSIFLNLGYTSDSCGWYHCDNNYGCSPEKAPANCNCTCADPK